MSRKKTVYIGIPAHNEENNIGSLLESIIMQKGANFTIQAIVVACDGCTDKTAHIVRAYSQKSSVIGIIDDGRRLGQAGRLNEFYRLAQSDIFITFDADTVLADEHVVSEIVRAFDNNNVAVVGGHDKPVLQNNFIGKSLQTYQMFWREMITQINGGDNVHHHPGCVSAARTDFLKEVTIPLGILANDHFLYFEALKRGYLFKAAQEAVVYFKVPTTLSDYFKQTTRFYDSADNVKAYFGSWVNAHYDIPWSIKLRAYAVTFFKSPFYLISALMLQVLQRLFSYRFTEKSTNGIWTPVKSSK